MNAGAEMRGTGDEIALVDVVRTDAAHEELLDERFHDHGIVVHVAEQDGLIAERDAGVGETAEGVTDFGGQFARVIGMHADEERMELLQHVAKLRRDALRKKNGDARTDADELDVLDGSKFTEKVSQLI